MRSILARTEVLKASNQAGTRPAGRSVDARPLDSRVLFAGGSELVIAHGPETYRLRLTRQNKLILTK